MDDFALAEDSPGAAGAASPAVSYQRASAQAVGPPDLHAQPGSADAGASSAYTAQWLDAIPEPAAEAQPALAQPALAPQSDHSTICTTQPNQAADIMSEKEIVASYQNSTGYPQLEPVEPGTDMPEEAAANRPKSPHAPPAAAKVMTEQRRISLTAPEEEEDHEGELPICPLLIRTHLCKF